VNDSTISHCEKEAKSRKILTSPPTKVEGFYGANQIKRYRMAAVSNTKTGVAAGMNSSSRSAFSPNGRLLGKDRFHVDTANLTLLVGSPHSPNHPKKGF
jgi:hypothetical protein